MSDPTGTRPRPGAVLRARREELGQTLAEVASATRIPLEHLKAIEADQLDALPTGPYATAYLAALEEHLDVSVSVDAAPPPPLRGLSLRWVRWIAVTSVVAMAGAMVWQVASIRGVSLPTVPVGPVAPVRDQRLVLTTRRTLEVAVRVDGVEAVHRVVPGGEVLEFEAFDRIEVDLPALDAVRLEHNGATIVPQGRQDYPRTIAFVDDLGDGA